MIIFLPQGWMIVPSQSWISLPSQSWMIFPPQSWTGFLSQSSRHKVGLSPRPKVGLPSCAYQEGAPVLWLKMSARFLFWLWVYFLGRGLIDYGENIEPHAPHLWHSHPWRSSVLDHLGGCLSFLGGKMRYAAVEKLRQL